MTFSIIALFIAVTVDTFVITSTWPHNRHIPHVIRRHEIWFQHKFVMLTQFSLTSGKEFAVKWMLSVLHLTQWISRMSEQGKKSAELVIVPMFMIRVEEHFIRNEQINKQTWNEEEEIIEQIDENSNNQKFINNLLQTNCSFDKIIGGAGVSRTEHRKYGHNSDAFVVAANKHVSTKVEILFSYSVNRMSCDESVNSISNAGAQIRAKIKKCERGKKTGRIFSTWSKRNKQFIRFTSSTKHQTEMEMPGK